MRMRAVAAVVLATISAGSSANLARSATAPFDPDSACQPKRGCIVGQASAIEPHFRTHNSLAALRHAAIVSSISAFPCAIET